MNVESVAFLLKAALLWLSLFGYISYLKKYMNEAFTPVFTLSSIGVLIFIAGLLNVMVLTVYLIVGFGLVCLILEKPWKKSFYQSNKKAFVVFSFFSIVCALFLVRLYGKIPVHYDCFSHWLTVIREMINTDSMPNFESSLISFQGYPTGSAGFVYFICKILGESRDDLVLFAQSIIYAGCICSFFAFVKKKDIIAFLAVITGSIFCIIANSVTNTTIENPLVDTLISFISVSVVSIVIYYRKDLLTGVLISLPLQLFLVAIKNSGILMVAINTGLIVCLSLINDFTERKKLSVKNIVKYGFLTAGIPAVEYYLWLQHIKYVFSDGATSKHTVSVENYAETLTSKASEQIEEILITFLNRFFSWNDAWLLLIIVSVILLSGMILKKLCLKKNSGSEFLVFAGICCAYFGFMGILAAMYLLSMPYKEAIVLAAYDRYENTILVYIIGAITIYCLTLISLFSKSLKGQIIKALVLFMLILTLSGQTANIKKLFTKNDIYTNSNRYQYEQLKTKEKIEEGKSYFIYGSRIENDARYNYHLTKYLFWSPDIFTCAPSAFEESQEKITQYDYLIIIDYDEQISAFLESKNIEPDKEVYKVKDVFQ